MKKITQNPKETAAFAKSLLRSLLRVGEERKGALVIGLCGELGAGKTTLTQEIVKLLGVKEKIISPTFVIMKTYKIPTFTVGTPTPKGVGATNLKHFVHIDVYRLEKAEELLKLGWQDLIGEPKNFILVEWADKIKKILPKDTIFICLEHKGGNKRKIELKKHGRKK